MPLGGNLYMLFSHSFSNLWHIRKPLPVSPFSYFSIGNVLLVVGSCTKMHGWLHRLVWTWVDTQQHLPPSRRFRIWFSMIWRSSADRPGICSPSERYPLRIFEDWFINIHRDSSVLKSASNISCTFGKTDRLKLPYYGRFCISTSSHLAQLQQHWSWL